MPLMIKHIYRLLLVVLLWLNVSYVEMVALNFCQTTLMKPLCPNTKVSFFLYNKLSMTKLFIRQSLARLCFRKVNKYLLDENRPKTIANAPFIPKVPVKILFHGYGGNLKTTPNKEIRYEYTKLGYNVISVDFSKVAVNPCFQQTIKNIYQISTCVTSFLTHLLAMDLGSRTVGLNYIHMLGFNVGAQIAASAGRRLKFVVGSVPRITAFDPDNPGLGMWPNYVSPLCARFVDSIHSYSVKLLGTIQYGHADFYIDNPAVFSKCKLWDVGCPTPSAAEYFAESINSQMKFCAIPVIFDGLTTVMGEVADPGAAGVYTVETNGEYPFAKDCKAK